MATSSRWGVWAKMSRAVNSTMAHPLSSASRRRMKPSCQVLRSMRCTSPWYSAMTRWRCQTKSPRRIQPPSSAKTSAFRRGSGRPALRKTNRERVSIGEPLPGRMSCKAKRSPAFPRWCARASTRAASSSSATARVSTASPTTTRASTPSIVPRSAQVSAGVVTVSPATSNTRRDSSPRCPVTPSIRGTGLVLGLRTWTDCAGCHRSGSGSSRIRAAVR